MDGVFPDLNRRGGHFGGGTGHLIGVVALGQNLTLGGFRLAGNAAGRLFHPFGVVHDGVHALADLRHHAVEGAGHRADFIVAAHVQFDGQVGIPGDLIHAIMQAPQPGKHQAAEHHGGQHEDHQEQHHLEAAAGEQLAAQLGVALGQGVIDPDGPQDLAFLSLVASQAVHALVILPGDHRFHQGVNPPFLVAAVGLDPLAAQGLLVQRIPLLLVVVAGPEGPVQVLATDHPHIQNVLGGHELLAQNPAVPDGAGHHHGVEAVEIGFGEALHVLVGERLQVLALGAGTVQYRQDQDQGESRGQGRKQKKLYRVMFFHGYPTATPPLPAAWTVLTDCSC